MSTRESTLSFQNWKRYQHYTDRRPPWIKLYSDFHEVTAHLSSDARLLACLLFCVAANKDNRIPDDPHWLSIEVSLPKRVVERAIDELIADGMLSRASTPASKTASKAASAPASESASPSRAPARSQEAEAETETEKRTEALSPTNRGEAAGETRERDDDDLWEHLRRIGCTQTDLDAARTDPTRALATARAAIADPNIEKKRSWYRKVWATGEYPETAEHIDSRAPLPLFDQCRHYVENMARAGLSEHEILDTLPGQPTLTDAQRLELHEAYEQHTTTAKEAA